MLKKSGAAILALVMTASLAAGCGNSENADANTASTQTQDVNTEETYDLSNVVFDESGKDKEETVYVKADADGSVNSISVETLLRVRDAGEITDITNLTDIRNTEGDEEFTEGRNGTITWENHGENIKYKGNSNADIPVDVEITYTLDGKEITAEELAGKSGHVTIRYDFKNNTSVKVNTQKAKGEDIEFDEDDDDIDIDLDDVDIPMEDVEVETVVPFVVLSIVSLNDGFSGVKVDNGAVMELSGSKMVVGYALPGLQEALDLDNLFESDDEDENSEDEKIELPEYVEIEADVTDFSLDFSSIIVTNGILEDFDVEDLDDVDQITAAAEILSKAADSIADGGGELADGAKEFEDYLGQYVDGQSSVKEGTSQLSSYMSQISSYKSALVSGASEISSALQKINNYISNVDMSSFEKVDLEKLYAALDAIGVDSSEVTAILPQLSEKISELQQWITTANNARALLDAVNVDIDTSELPEEAVAVIEAAKAAKEQLDSLDIPEDIDLSQLKELTDDMSSQVNIIAGLMSELQKEYPELKNVYAAFEQLKSQIASLSSGSTSLSDGISTASSAIDSLVSGVQSLDEGVGLLQTYGAELVDAMSEFAEGCTTLQDALKTFSEDGIDSLKDIAGDNLAGLAARIRALKKADDSYYNFGGIAEGKTGSVKFMIETDEISE